MIILSMVLFSCAEVRTDQSGARDHSIGGSPGVFGVKDEMIFGFKGDIYAMPSGMNMIPYFPSCKHLGTIFTDSLNVPVRNFEEGFPGVTDRTEWFAINYSGCFYIKKESRYSFMLTSDDGSKLYIDNQLVVNNDGGHPEKTESNSITLTRGLHDINVQYYQGPRYGVALVLRISESADPGTYKVFKISDFIPAKVSVANRRTVIVLSDDCLFDFDKADVKDGSKKILDEVFRFYLSREKFRTLLVEGHSDNIGTDARNMEISFARAENVRQYLVGLGVDRRKIFPKGLGKTKPRLPNNSEENRALNRRIELILLR